MWVYFEQKACEITERDTYMGLMPEVPGKATESYVGLGVMRY